MKTNLKISLLATAYLLAALIAPRLEARVVDNFDDDTKTGWTDFNFPVGIQYSTITEANGQFKFSLIPVSQSIFSASTKSTETYTLQDGRTLEFRVDLVEGNGHDAFAVLAFIPTASSVSSLAGYGFAKSSTDILISKGIDKYFYNENVEPPVKNTNVTMVLSLTGQGTSVIINAKVLDKDNHDAVLWERTIVDTEGADILADGEDNPAVPYTGPGNLALYCYEDDGKTQPVYEVTLDNLEAFVLDNTVLDNFDDNTKTAWTDFNFPIGVPYSTIVEANGQFKFTLAPVGQSIFSASTKTSRPFDLTNGERLVFSVDLVEGLGKDSFAVLGFFPSAAAISGLAGYGLAKSETDILITKGIDKYFYNENVDPPVKNNNVTLVLSLEGRGTSVVINAKVLDQENDHAVLWERTVIDTEDADILADGTDDPARPYLGSGNVALFCYEDDGKTQSSYEVTYDNLRVSAAPVAANTPPIITEVKPEPYANFLSATNQVTFTVSDDKPLNNDRITVTLNGQVFNSANGLTISGSGNARTVSLAGLSNNVNYAATLQVVDADNAASTVALYFDTFAPHNLLIEAEDFNFNSGQFADDPNLIPEGQGPDLFGYRNQFGTFDVDYYDSRTSLNDVPYRPSDLVRMQRTLDLLRQKYIDAGGAEQGYYDYDIGDITAGEWLNYTRTFPAGAYEVYLRQSVVNLAQSECVLERVTSSSSEPGQTVETLGSFRGSTTGFRYRNFPLTDAAGLQLIKLQLEGVQTFRLRQVTPDTDDGKMYQNYLVFVPTASAGVPRPLITRLSPAPGAVVSSVTPVISISIRNRETMLNPETIRLELNGGPIDPEVTGDFDQTFIDFAISPLPAPNTTNQARLIFADNEGIFQTNAWSFVVTYRMLDPRNRQSGQGTNSGFRLRMVQASSGSNLENNLARAEAQLAPNSIYPAVMDTNTMVPYINLSHQAPSDQYISVPGLYDENGSSLGNGTDDFAVEALAYLELAAGVYRFGFKSDDGYKITSGATLRDLNAPVLGGHNGGPADETFDFVVAQPGLYPFRMVWYERGGGAHASWVSVDVATSERVLINDPAVPASIKAYADVVATLTVQSAATVLGPFADDASATIDTVAKKITIPTSGNTRFYRLSADTVYKLTGIQVSGGTAALTYE